MGDASSLIDSDSRTKWLDLGRGELQIRFPAPVMLDGYQFFTAPDSPERDPIRWRLGASNDGGLTYDTLHDLTVDHDAPQDRSRLFTTGKVFDVPPCYEEEGDGKQVC